MIIIFFETNKTRNDMKNAETKNNIKNEELKENFTEADRGVSALAPHSKQGPFQGYASPRVRYGSESP